MKVDATLIKQLRTETGLGVMDCKQALEKSDGDMDAARKLLKGRGVEIVNKKAGRTTAEGILGGYVHTGGKLGCLVEVNCETDFVARNDLFQEFTKNICLQVVATNPPYLKKEDVPEQEISERKEVWLKEITDKPAAIQEKILVNKVADYYRQVVLLEQPYIREPEKTIQEYLNETIARLGENLIIRRYVRMEIGG